MLPPRSRVRGRLRRLGSGAAVAALAGGAIILGGAGPSAAVDQTVVFGNSGATPSAVTISAGDSVTFTNAVDPALPVSVLGPVTDALASVTVTVDGTDLATGESTTVSYDTSQPVTGNYTSMLAGGLVQGPAGTATVTITVQPVAAPPPPPPPPVTPKPTTTGPTSVSRPPTTAPPHGTSTPSASAGPSGRATPSASPRILPPATVSASPTATPTATRSAAGTRHHRRAPGSHDSPAADEGAPAVQTRNAASTSGSPSSDVRWDGILATLLLCAVAAALTRTISTYRGQE